MIKLLISPEKQPKVLDIVAKEYGVKASDIKGKSRKRKIAHARQMYAFIMKDVATPNRLASELNLSHSNINYFQSNIKEWVVMYQDTREHYENILTSIDDL